VKPSLALEFSEILYQELQEAGKFEFTQTREDCEGWHQSKTAASGLEGKLSSKSAFRVICDCLVSSPSSFL
jgi:hypothetical protein